MHHQHHCGRIISAGTKFHLLPFNTSALDEEQHWHSKLNFTRPAGNLVFEWYAIILYGFLWSFNLHTQKIWQPNGKIDSSTNTSMCKYCPQKYFPCMQIICVCLSFRMSYIHPSSLLSHTLEELARLNKQSRFDSAPILSHVTCPARHTWIVFGPQLQKSRHDCHKSQNSVKQSEARCQSWHRWLKCQHYRAPCLWSSQPRYPDTYPFFFAAVTDQFLFQVGVACIYVS